jgi:hypothetical protein
VGHELRAIGKPGLRRDGRPAMPSASKFLMISNKQADETKYTIAYP